MASGGHKKSSSSEPRQRSSWQRTTSMSDKEDNLSMNSVPNELRPNNWDFSDWRPTAHKDQTKRRKKGNPEWEREQTLPQDSPPASEHRHGTPRTFPRTKITPSTPTSQRVALENLRQHMTFSDQEDAMSNDGERNNERNIYTRRENPANLIRQEMNMADGPLTRPIPNRRDDRNNRNNNKQNDVRQADGKVDSSQLVGRLMQIRDYIKQAGSMMDSLKKSGDPYEYERSSKLTQLLSSWKDQEKECLAVLHHIWPGYKEEMDRLQKLMDHLQEREQEYTGLLQSILAVRDEAGINDMGRDATPNQESAEDTQSVDLDVQSELSDRELNYLVPMPMFKTRTASASSRPRIEDKLGLTSDNDDDDDDDDDEPDAGQSDSSDKSSTLDDTVVSGRKLPDWGFELGEEELATGGVLNPKEAAEQLAALKEQQQLLTKLVEQQEQMRALRDRQSALLALQQDAEQKLTSAREKRNEAQEISSSLEETASSMVARVDALDANPSRQTDGDLHDLRQELQYLRNELKSQNQNMHQSQPVQKNQAAESAQRKVPPPRPPSPKIAEIPPTQMSKDQIQAKLNDLLQKKDRIDHFLESEFTRPPVTTVTEDMNRDELVDKLTELQTKKKRMDEMLHELHSIKDNPYLNLNNVSAPSETPSAPAAAQTRISEGEAALAMAEGTENMANDVLGLLGARDKLSKLNEVRGRLNQLKSLMHYYQTDGATVGPADGDEASLLPAGTDYRLEAEVTRDTGPATAFNEMGSQFMRQLNERKPAQETTKPKVNIPVQPQPQSDENNSSSESDSESESQLSSLGPWGDDPEIQEKVRKLKDAKEKLRNLQSLVAMVQHSPDVAGELPDNLAASLEDAESQATQTDDRNNASVSDGEVPVPAQPDRDAYYQSKMQEQLEELDELKDEKTRLLAIQSQLQTLHDRFQTDEAKSEEREETKPKAQTRPQQQQQQQDTTTQSSGPSVTFSSNEEVYDKMRKQRMLREELRDKKKQLESIMKKDRNKKQYYKNQDNQSDAVSYTTDTFGASASADATMATWGGSTVDNLESITEDGGGDQPDNDDDDDAYPSDGILQVEEEEEENNSDNETYTIEDDVRQRRKARAMAQPSVEPNLRQTKPKRSFPRPIEGEAARSKEGNWTGTQPSFSQWSRHPTSKQENYRSAKDIVQDNEGVDGPQTPQTAIEALKTQLEQTSMLCQSVLADQQTPGSMSRLPTPGFGGMGQLPDLQQQLQQQQLMMSMNQCYQQIAMQQMDIQNMQRQMQSVLYRTADGSDAAESLLAPDMRVRSMNSLFSPMQPRPSPQVPNDGFVFSPQLARSDRLLRGAIPEDTTLLESEKSYPGAQATEPGGAVQRNLFRKMPKYAKRQTRSESSAQSLKKKTLSPSQPKTSSMAVQANMRLHQTEETRTSAPDKPVAPLEFERYLARKKREFAQRNKLHDTSVQHTSDTGERLSAQASGRQPGEEYRPGLSAGISGAGYLEDGRSVASSALSSVAAVTQAMGAQAKEQRDSDDNNEMSLFETLRETIYSEVATLISQNENRPHYLIELFRELQLLSTDYLRQRVLYDIKDVVSKYLVDENSESVSAPPPLWMNPVVNNFAASELTPSESLVTSDDEEVKYLLQAKLRSDAAPGADKHKTAMLLRTGSMKNDEFDYQEAAETLQRMREYEKKIAEEQETRVKVAAGDGPGIEREVSSSAMDQGSESSVTSDAVPYPRIDTQQLDQQIKAIMTEVIPVIKEHMDNMCSPQLLAYIKRLVLSLTRQYDGGQEFARFFHRQLGSILQDSLAKYEGRKMRECGEDLLVDMSEVLFNELAFFRLMQDLDDPLIAEKMRQAQVWSDTEDDKDDEMVESDTTESSTATGDNNTYDTKLTQTEEEDLGKMRDDEFANEVVIQDADDKDEEPESPFKAVQIELAPSETKPYTRIGSDEDDEDEDADSQSNEDPSETAVSLNAKLDVEYADDFEDEIDSEAEKQDGDDIAISSPMVDLAQAQFTPGQNGQDWEAQGQITPDQGDADQGAGTSGKVEVVCNSVEHMNGDLLNGDMEVISMDELPASLNVMSAEDLQNKVYEEQKDNSGAAAVLQSVNTQGEMAGDAQFLKEPDEASG